MIDNVVNKTASGCGNFFRKESGMGDSDGLKVFSKFAGRVMILHTATYILFGIIMSKAFHYDRLFEMEIIRDYMRPIDSKWVLMGPLLQPLRGLLFSIGLWPLRGFLIESRRGWMILWSIFLVFGIASTPAAAPCSVEGIIYSKLPLWYHLIGFPEIGLQTLIFSILFMKWEKRSMRTGAAPGLLKYPRIAEFMKALTTSCFAWMGYAVGGLISVEVVRSTGTRPPIDIHKAAGDLRIQMMFVAAFVVNLILIYGTGRWWRSRRTSWGIVFLVFWGVETVVPWLYQWIFTHPSPVHLALLLGFFPAAVIAGCIRLSYNKHKD